MGGKKAAINAAAPAVPKWSAESAALTTKHGVGLALWVGRTKQYPHLKRDRCELFEERRSRLSCSIAVWLDLSRVSGSWPAHHEPLITAHSDAVYTVLSVSYLASYLAPSSATLSRVKIDRSSRQASCSIPQRVDLGDRRGWLRVAKQEFLLARSALASPGRGARSRLAGSAQARTADKLPAVTSQRQRHVTVW